MIYYISINS